MYSSKGILPEVDLWPPPTHLGTYTCIHIHIFQWSWSLAKNYTVICWYSSFMSAVVVKKQHGQKELQGEGFIWTCKCKGFIWTCKCKPSPWRRSQLQEHKAVGRITSTAKNRKKEMQTCSLASLCLAYSSTGQKPLPREQCCPQWAGFFTSVYWRQSSTYMLQASPK